jgi:hypothetical protein
MGNRNMLLDKETFTPILSNIQYDIGERPKWGRKDNDLIFYKELDTDLGPVVCIIDTTPSGWRNDQVHYFIKDGRMLGKEEVLSFIKHRYKMSSPLKESNLYRNTSLGNEHGYEITFSTSGWNYSLNVALPSVVDDFEKSSEEISTTEDDLQV